MLGGDTEAKLIAEFPHDIVQLTWHSERLAILLDSDETQVMLFNTQVVSLGQRNILCLLEGRIPP